LTLLVTAVRSAGPLSGVKMTTSRSGAVALGPAEPLHAVLRMLSRGGVAAAPGWIESIAPRARAVSGDPRYPDAPVAAGALSEADRVVSADPLSGVEAPWAALSVWAGELSRGDGTVLSPAWLWPIALTGAAKLKRHNAMRSWCKAMRPESIGLRSTLQVYSAGKVCAATYTGV
jgi:hypothetical protein